jgi:hypothetical protein
MLLPLLELLFGKKFLSAPPPSSLSRISVEKPGSGGRSLSGTNNTAEMEKRKTRDEMEERMGAVLLLEEPGPDEEGGQNQRSDNIRQRRLQHT